MRFPAPPGGGGAAYVTQGEIAACRGGRTVAAMVAMSWEGWAWHGAPRDKVSAPLWTALGDCGGALISLCQGLSASVMFTPQVCWLLADCSAKAPSYQPELTGSANRNPPTDPADQTLPITALPLSIYKPLFHKVYLLTYCFSPPHPSTSCFSLCNLSSTLYSPVWQWIWDESSFKRISIDPTKKGLDLPQHMLAFIQSSG